MKKISKTQQNKNRRNYRYIRNVYNAIEDKKGVTYIQFKHRVQAASKRDGVNLREAARKEANTQSFVSAAERSRVNLVQGIKSKFKEEYKMLREMTKDEKGRYRRIEDILKWDKDRGAYVFSGFFGDYMIDFTNSPEAVYFQYLGV